MTRPSSFAKPGCERCEQCTQFDDWENSPIGDTLDGAIGECINSECDHFGHIISPKHVACESFDKFRPFAPIATKGKPYLFHISYLTDAGDVDTFIEKKNFLNEGSAYIYFQDLLDKYNVGPYYYLCSCMEGI